SFDFDAIRRALSEHAHDVMLVEGAGGLLCPLGGTQTMADLAAHLALTLLIVARSGLGTINHTLLSISEARRRRLAIARAILNQVCPDRRLDEATNPELIERLGDVRIVGRMHHGASQLATQSIVGQ